MINTITIEKYKNISGFELIFPIPSCIWQEGSIEYIPTLAMFSTMVMTHNNKFINLADIYKFRKKSEIFYTVERNQFCLVRHTE
jgi:hypothetical protein